MSLFVWMETHLDTAQGKAHAAPEVHVQAPPFQRLGVLPAEGHKDTCNRWSRKIVLGDM